MKNLTVKEISELYGFSHPYVAQNIVVGLTPTNHYTPFQYSVEDVEKAINEISSKIRGGEKQKNYQINDAVMTRYRELVKSMPKMKAYKIIADEFGYRSAGSACSKVKSIINQYQTPTSNVVHPTVEYEKSEKNIEDLLPIKVLNNIEVISARDLHSYLEIATPFTMWIERMFEYGFEENVDYQPLNIFVNSYINNGGTNKTDYALVIDCAKEISMLQRTEKGRIARKYFISRDKKLRNIETSFTEKEPLSQLAIIKHSIDVLIEQQEVLNEHAEKIHRIESQLKTSVDDNFSIVGYCSLIGKRVNHNEAKSLGIKASRYCKDNGINIYSTKDSRFGTVNIYPKDVLEKII